MVTTFSLSLKNNKNRGIPYFLKITQNKRRSFHFYVEFVIYKEQILIKTKKHLTNLSKCGIIETDDARSNIFLFFCVPCYEHCWTVK